MKALTEAREIEKYKKLVAEMMLADETERIAAVYASHLEAFAEIGVS